MPLINGNGSSGRKMSKRRESVTPGQLRKINRTSSDVHMAQPMSLPPDLTSIHTNTVLKVMLLGDSNVGKTCLMLKFSDGHFLSGTYISTVGVDFRNKVMEVDGESLRVQIWDTAGQERFRSVTHSYYREAHALLLVYDVTNRVSFANTRAWLADISEYSKSSSIVLLIGNKCDRASDRVVRYEEGENLAKENRSVFIETSAKTGVNVVLAFTAVVREWRHRRRSPNSSSFNVEQYVESRTQRTSTCPCAS